MSRSPFGFCIAAFLIFCAASLPGCGGDVTGVNAQSVAALAGAAGGPGFFDGTGAFVRFAFPSGVTAIGTDLFVADNNNHVIRKIDTTTGAVTTLAGAFGVSGVANGTGAAARFNSPTGIVAVGTILFVCDTGNHAIRRIVSTSGEVTTLAGTPGSSGFADDNTALGVALFSSPRGIATDGGTILGAILYVADTGNHRIRRVTLTGATFTVAGSGTSGANDNVGTLASFSSPEGVAFLLSDVYVADTGNHTIRRITSPGTVGSVTTFAGATGAAGFLDNTTGTLARFSSPSALTAVGAGTDLYVADTGNHVIRKIDGSAFVTTLAGGALAAGFADGIGTAARFNGPKGVGTDGASIYVADTQNHAIRRVTTGGAVTTAAGNPPQAGTADGTGASARFRAPAGAAVIGDNVLVADTGNHTIRRATSSGEVTLLAGSAGTPGTVDGAGSAARFNNPQGIAAVGTDLYVADAGNHAIRKVTAAGVVTTFAGIPGTPGFVNDTGTLARFNTPRGIATDGSFLFVADSGNHAIRKIGIATGAVTTLAGTGASGYANTPAATFNGPEGVAVIGTNLYVADTGNHAVRKIADFNAISPAVTTFAGAGPPTAASGFVDGSGSAARFSSPRGITAVGSVLYLADTGNHAIRRITSAATVTTFVGTSEAATTRDGDANQALLNAPVGIAGVPGTIYFTDVNENVVRKILF
jgi:sugar lactone lactonase YvrE